MDSALFHIAPDGSLSEMKPQQYDNEDHIQRLLADHPAILGADQYRGVEPRRWALIQREMSVPDGASLDRRWSLDHLYVDQDAVPTLIEVKRSRDTRSRREVIGQMFDYAANGPSYWSLNDLRDSFALTHKQVSADPTEALRLLLGEDINAEEFWTCVEENLRAGRIRLIFLVDEMPPELLRIVEFLARQLRDVEVYAVEVRQHTGAGGQVLATRVLGHSQNDENKVSRTVAPRLTLTEDEWFARFAKLHGADAEEIVRKIYAWAIGKGLEPFITTAQTPNLGFKVKQDGVYRYPLFVGGKGKVDIVLSYLKNSPTFSSAEARQELVDAIAAIGVPFKLTSLDGNCGFPAVELREGDRLQRYLDVITHVVDRLQKK